MAHYPLCRYWASGAKQGPGTDRTLNGLAQPRAYTHRDDWVPDGWKNNGLKDWVLPCECIDGYVETEEAVFDRDGLKKIYAHNRGGYLRYTEGKDAPQGWADSVGLQVPFCGVHDQEVAGTVPLYQLSWWSSDLGTHLQLLTTSPHEWNQAQALGWMPGVPQDSQMGVQGASLANPVLGHVYPATLQAVLTQTPDVVGGMRQAALMQNRGQKAALHPGESLEITIDPDYPEMTIESIGFMDHEPPATSTDPGDHAFTVNADDQRMNMKTLQNAQGTWKVTVWQNGPRALRIVQHGTGGVPIWYLMFLRDGSGNRWIFDPEILDQTGGDQGPGWGGTATGS